MTSSEFVGIRANWNGKPYKPAGYLFCVDGTAYPGTPGPPGILLDDGTGFWSGFSSGIAGGLANVADGLWASNLIAYNTVSPIPTNKARDAGIASLAASIGAVTDNYYRNNGNSYNGLVIAISGYSLGAIITGTYWQTYVLNPTGPHHYLAPYIYRIYQFGDPLRCPSVAHGNALSGLPESIQQDGVETGGIGGKLDLTVAQSNLLAPDGKYIYNSCANKGDIYACSPIGLNPWTAPAGPGKVGNLIFQEVMSPSITNTLKIAEALGSPIGMVEEIVNGMTFLAEGTSAPHWLYMPQLLGCINDALALGNSLPHELGV